MRLLLRVVSALLSSSTREDWRLEWEAEAAQAEADGRSVLRIVAWAMEDAIRMTIAHGFTVARQETRTAFRSLARSPGYTALVVATLALGVGANTTVFSVVNAVLLRPLPLSEPGRVVNVTRSNGPVVRTALSAPNYLDLRARARSFAELIAVAPGGVTLTGAGAPRRVTRARVRPGFFEMLGVAPEPGRAFDATEGVEGRDRRVILSHGLWVSAFGAEAAVLGRTVELGGLAHTVVGVAPEGFWVPSVTADLYTPLSFDADALEARGRNNLVIIGRLADGVALADARGEVGRIGRTLAAEYPESNAGWALNVAPTHEVAVGRPTARALWTLLGASGVVLLIACVNVAGLVLVRGIARSPEVAVRIALGASRRRLVALLLSETAVLTALGGLAGLALAWSSLGLVRNVVPAGLVSPGKITIDPRVLVFAFTASVATGLVAGLTPARRLVRKRSGGGEAATRTNAPRLGPLDAALRRQGTSPRLGSGLVGVQLALTTVLLVGAGLLGRTLAALGSVDVGVRTEGLTTFRLSLPAASYGDPEEAIRATRFLVDGLSSRADVEAAAATSHLPLTGFRLNSSVIHEGGPVEHTASGPDAAIKVVTPEYFSIMGMPLVQGRGFTVDDGGGAEPVAVVNRTAAEEYWPDEDPVGRWVSYTEDAGGLAVRRKIVGVVGDVHWAGPSTPPEAEIYQPVAQTSDVWRWFGRNLDFVVRTRDGSPLPISGAQQVVGDLDPNLPVVGLRPIDAVYRASVATPRFHGTLVGLFAALALFLAVVGVYGVSAFTVHMRRQEIGIRKALGADRLRIVSPVLGRVIRTALAAAAVGLAASALVAKAAASLVWGVSALDPISYLGAAGVLLLVAIAAAAVPAVGAMQVDPSTTLNSG